MRAAAAAQRFERAGWLRRRRERLQWLLGVLGGAVAATHARPRLVLAEHPRGGRHDAFWLVGGRVADWGPLPELAELQERTAGALRGDGRAHAALTPDDVDEARTVGTWLERNPSPGLDLRPAPSPERLAAFVRTAAR
jgi:DNA polymerase-3 subunit epsilon